MLFLNIVKYILGKSILKKMDFSVFNDASLNYVEGKSFILYINNFIIQK